MSNHSPSSPPAHQVSWQPAQLRILLGIVTLPSLLAIAAAQLAARQLTAIEQNSVEVFRGKRLPVIPFPTDASA